MKIGIDARWIFRETSGISTYTRELIRQLARMDSANDYVLFFHDRDILEDVSRYASLRNAPTFEPVLLPYDVFSPVSQLRFPRLIASMKLDVFHSPNYMIPLLAFPRNRAGHTKCVVTIHDLIPLLFPEFTPRAKKTRLMPVYRALMAEIGARADTILTVSECSRQDVLRVMKIPGDRHGVVRAIPNGVAEEYRPGLGTGGTAKTILYVGRFDPYKNVQGLLRTFARVRELTRMDVRLRIVGAADPRYPEGPAMARELGVDGFVDWTGYAGGPDLVRAYQRADVFVLLSKYEGFGLTVLEAMACGAPVVCSNRSSLPEVAGDAAVLVDPEDREGAAKAVVRILEDSEYAGGLREKGLDQAGRFRWMRTAALTLDAYVRAAGKR